MERVLGIGGLFFRAKDPVALAEWYEKHLGVSRVPSDYGGSPWQQQSGPTAFAPFAEDSGTFGDPARTWMINFRVRDLDAIVAQLENDRIPVTVDPERYPNGRFARLHDPEGNPVELWEPEGRDAPPSDR
jgi:glyoxylase I family protein